MIDGDSIVVATPENIDGKILYPLIEQNQIGKELSHSDITIAAIPDQTYSGSEICPAVIVNDGETTLVLGTDYTVECADNVSAGTAKMTITGAGDYPGSISKTFEILKADPTMIKAPVAVENLVYNGKAQTLVTAGEAKNGVMVYKLEGAEKYSETLPTATEVGEYTVFFMVQGNENYNDLKAQTLTATITAPASSSSVEESSSSVEESSSSVEIASSSSSSRNDVVSSSSRNDESSSSSSKEKKDGFAPVVASGLNVQFVRNELTVTVPTASEVKVYVFDLQGNLKKRYHGQSAGTHSVSLGQLNQGLYLVRVVSSGNVQTLRAQVK